MVFEHIEKLKEEYTDKFVSVDNNRPELKRFDGLVGRVKTVNMSGRALVEFDTWINNIGWYDIDVDFLKVLDDSEVAAKVETAKAAPKAKEKPKAAAKPSELEKSRGTAATPAAKGGAGMSMADILAAARGGTAPASKEESDLAEAKGAERPSKPSGGQMSVEEMMAAARASAGGGGKAAAPKAEAPKKDAAPAAAKDAKSMSVAEMMAAARASAGGAPAPAAEPSKESAPPAAKAETPAAPAKKKPTSGVDTTGMTVEQMLALARDQASGKAPAPAKAPKPEAKPEPAEPAEEPAAEAPAPEPEPEPQSKAASSGELPKDVAGIVAFCRQADG